MSEKIELTNDTLEKVTGGDTYTSEKDIRFLFGIGLHVEICKFRLFYQFTSGGSITKTGYTNNNGVYSPCYYITCPDDPDDSGWYDEDYIQDYTYTHWKKVSLPVTVVEG